MDQFQCDDILKSQTGLKMHKQALNACTDEDTFLRLQSFHCSQKKFFEINFNEQFKITHESKFFINDQVSNNPLRTKNVSETIVCELTIAENTVSIHLF